MQNSGTVPHKYIPLRSPTPPLNSSSEDLNELEQELEHLDDADEKRPHFLDEAIPPPDSELISAQAKSLPFSGVAMSRDHRRTGGPMSLSATADTMKSSQRGADRMVSSDRGHSSSSSKKHFLDENPVPPDYDYGRLPSTSDGIERKVGAPEVYQLKYESRHATKSKKSKEPSFALSRFLEDASQNAEASGSALNARDGESDAFDAQNDNVFSILSMIGLKNSAEMANKFLELSKSPDSCASLRHSRCIPLLVQMIHCESDEHVKRQARQALHNVVNNHLDDKTGRRETKVLRNIEQIMDYCELLKRQLHGNSISNVPTDGDFHPLQAMSSLVRISFDEEHRHAMCQLGALQTIATLVHLDHASHGSNSTDAKCISLRRNAGSALTNLTFGDGNNKALLCANKEFMKALVAQIDTDNDGLLQATANVLRNLSWRPDNKIKSTLKEIGTVTALMVAAMKNERKNKNENTLRAILSALWNLSAHCSSNKEELCLVNGALAFLCDMLTYEAPSKTLSIIENSGGILNNVSSHIAVNEDFRRILRHKNCLGILLQQLDSESLTIVGNACGTLWNLSARCSEDQKFLRDNGAVPKLRLLINSTHKMISEGSLAALKNLVHFRPGDVNRRSMDSVSKSIKVRELPTLNVRKQRALEQEFGHNLPETSDKVRSSSHRDESGSVSLSAVQVSVSESVTRPIASSLVYESMRIDSKRTGTIPKRSASNEQSPSDEQWDSLPPKPTTTDKPKNESEMDQITNFSLMYDEKDHEAKVRGDTFVDDSTKCYEMEGTPQTFLSHAGSDNDLRSPHVAIDAPLKRVKEEHAVDYSGVQTPEKPIYYCEEGTPMYFSRHDSFSSLDGECQAKNVEDSNKRNTQANERQAIPVDKAVTEPKESDTTPASPSDAAAKSVKFNEFLETPMMFSRQSSIESLASIEPALAADDQSSVVSEISRMPSGNISPSELPDSPSQTMPQSPQRRRRSEMIATQNVVPPRGTTFEDEVKLFDVENTPALISCATSLSNLSLDDEPKIATDCLIKEMRLMHQLSDEQEDAGASTSASFFIQPKRNDSRAVDGDAKPTEKSDQPSNEGDETEVSSVSGDSVNDSMLLASCISIGMKAKTRATDANDVDEPILIDSLPLKQPIRLEPEVVTELSSDEEPNADDDLLLQKCIEDGMQAMTRSSNNVSLTQSNPIEASRVLIKENPIGMFRKGGHHFVDSTNDETNRFQVEDSPCNYSIVSGLSDLTIGSNRIGIAKLQRLPSTHENVSAEMSGERSLSPISVLSEADQHILDQVIAAGIQRMVGSSTSTKTAALTVDAQNEIGSNLSISSIESNNSKDEELLQQCIKRGMEKFVQKAPTASAATPFHGQDDADADANLSLSSIGSNDSKDEELLQQVIQRGMEKFAQSSQSRTRPSTSSVHQSVVPPKPAKRFTQSLDRTDDIESNHSISSIGSNDSKDEELLQQCIELGMKKKLQGNPIGSPKPVIAKRSQLPQLRQPQLPIARKIPSKNEANERQVMRDANSKNDRTTSATASKIVGANGAVPDVVMSSHQRSHGTSNNKVSSSSSNHNNINGDVHELDPRHSVDRQTLSTKRTSKVSENDEVEHEQRADITVVIDEMREPAVTTPEIGYNICATTALNASIASVRSLNTGDSAALLDRSNEYPAGVFGISDSCSSNAESECGEMDVSNEFLYENLSPKKIDKHKDPELMLRSVERLTHDFVSTAEYLRTANAFDDDVTLTEDRNESSNNTWNEDSKPNDVSFPSISRSAPKIAEDDDDGDDATYTYTDKLAVRAVEDVTPTGEDKTLIGDETGGATSPSGVNFRIGGKTNHFVDVEKRFSVQSNLSNSINSVETSSTMTNSTIIAMEANKIRSGLMTFCSSSGNDSDGDSMISLDKIRPPSVMDKLQMSSLSEQPSSLKTPVKCLQQGFMARRALNALSTHGSLDSVNSISNIDRVKPPSLMDELLDSMISVDSIASEFVDAPLQIEEPSNYETAFSECDDMTMTLKNCDDLPFDDTPNGSDIGSIESTPKKNRRSITPRRRRQMTKERYQTYTITADNVGNANQQANNSLEYGANDAPNDESDEISLVSTDDDEMSSIRALTKKLTYLNDINTNTFTRKASPKSPAKQVKTEEHIDDVTYCIEAPANNQPKQIQAKSQVEPPRSATPTKAPRIIKPSESPRSPVSVESLDDDTQGKAVRGRKKATYVSPYKMTRLARPSVKPVAPPVIKSITPPAVKTPPTTKIASPKKTPTVKTNESIKTTPASVEQKPKSLIQRSAESLRKMRPSFTSKLSKTNNSSASTLPPRQSPEGKAKSVEQSPEPMLIRQNTFTKDEPSVDEIPVIASEPTSPKRISKIASKIPFNRSVSATVQSNVQKSKTNIEISTPRSASIGKRNVNQKTNGTAMPPSAANKQKANGEPSSGGRSIFRRLAPLQKPSQSLLSKFTANKSPSSTSPSREASSNNLRLKSDAKSLSFRGTTKTSRFSLQRN